MRILNNDSTTGATPWFYSNSLTEEDFSPEDIYLQLSLSSSNLITFVCLFDNIYLCLLNLHFEVTLLYSIATSLKWTDNSELFKLKAVVQKVTYFLLVTSWKGNAGAECAFAGTKWWACRNYSSLPSSNDLQAAQWQTWTSGCPMLCFHDFSV